MIFRLVLPFFGLTPDYRPILFKQIHEIVFKGGGGFDYGTVYNMPVWIRNFTFMSLKEHYEKEAEAVSKSNVSTLPTGPDVESYRTKVKR